MSDETNKSIPNVKVSGSDGKQSSEALTGQVLSPTETPFQDEAMNAQLTQMMASESGRLSGEQAQNWLLARQLDQSSTISHERSENSRLTECLHEKEKQIGKLNVEVATLKQQK